MDRTAAARAASTTARSSGSRATRCASGARRRCTGAGPAYANPARLSTCRQRTTSDFGTSKRAPPTIFPSSSSSKPASRRPIPRGVQGGRHWFARSTRSAVGRGARVIGLLRLASLVSPHGGGAGLADAQGRSAAARPPCRPGKSHGLVPGENRTPRSTRSARHVGQFRPHLRRVQPSRPALGLRSVPDRRRAVSSSTGATCAHRRTAQHQGPDPDVRRAPCELGIARLGDGRPARQRRGGVSAAPNGAVAAGDRAVRGRVVGRR